MSRPASITVTVARGCHVTVPHPSGIKELPGRVLSGGDTFATDPDTAGDLFSAKLINNPATGAAPPTPVAIAQRPSGPMISIDGGPFQSMESNLCLQPNWAATADFARSEDHAPKPPPHNCFGPPIDMMRVPGETW